jgi:intracellular sulfur oxidation DsrE/DsrF family protein
MRYHLGMRPCLRAAGVLVVASLGSVPPASGQPPAARPGPVIEQFGAVFTVPSPDLAIPAGFTFKLLFDVSQAAAAADQVNARLDAVARFLNMHAQAGVHRDRLHAAIVVHGAAGKDLLQSAAYRAKFETDNPNQPLVEALLKSGVRIVLCGQTAMSRGLDREKLIDGVQVALSAMTAHAILQEEDYRIVPF